MPPETNEQLEAGGQVAGAAVEAAAAQPTPAKARTAASRAARETAKKVQIELSEEDADMLASALIAQMEARGAFDQPPEPVTAPSVAAPGTEPAAQQQVAPVEPRRRSFAEHFRGVR